MLDLPTFDPRERSRIRTLVGVAPGELALSFGTGACQGFLDLGFMVVIYGIAAGGSLPPAGAESAAGRALQQLRTALPGVDSVGVLTTVAMALVLVRVGLRAVYTASTQRYHSRVRTYYRRRVVDAYLGRTPEEARLDRRETLLALLQEHCPKISQLAVLGLELGTTACCSLLLGVAGLGFSPALAAVVLAVTLVSCSLHRVRFYRARRDGRELMAMQEDLTRLVLDTTEGFAAVKLEALEEDRRRKLGASFERIERHVQGFTRRQFVASSGAELVFQTSLIGLTASAVVIGTMATADLVVMIALFHRFQGYLLGLQNAVLSVQDHRPGWEEVHGFLEGARTVSVDAEPLYRAGTLPGHRGRRGMPVRLEGVGFAYSPDAPPVLEDVSLDVRPGERILVQGPSGIGKSTLLRLVAGGLAPKVGRIVLDGQELDPTSFLWLRNWISWCSPDTHLFDASLAYNLRFDEGVTDATLLDTLGAVRARDILESLRGDLDAPVGGGGSRLSLGQCQRVMLARALVKEPRLLLLDEATCHLDRGNEAGVLAQLLERLPFTTVIMVTHRTGLEFPFDRVYDLEGGRLHPRVPEARRVSAPSPARVLRPALAG